MHPCFNVDEILSLFARELVVSKAKATAVALACCCKGFEGPVLDALWETQKRLTPLLKCIPQDVWEEGNGGFAFKRIPTRAEWAHSRKHAQRMRRLMVNTSKDPVTSDILQVLQLRTVNDPWLPRLRIFVLKGATEAFTPVIPLFLSAQTTVIHIIFAKGLPTTVVVSTISWLPKLCPNLEYIGLEKLPRHPVITEAVSEMLLAYNRDTLREFRVDSPLTEEAREIVYRLPKLMVLWMVIQGPTLLPTVILPNLTAIRVECNDDLNWLQGFRGATLEKLEFIVFHTERNDIGDFLEAFERVALTTSIKNTLSGFRFHTSRPWNPNYSSLLSFSQLKELEIHFSCEGGCSSRVDDDIIVSLARAMPKLEVLRLGDIPCNTPTGITVNGLINLACRCPHLLKLRIHFQTTTLVGAATNATAPSPSDKPAVLRKDSALTYLEVGATPIPARSGTMIAHILLQIFPRILNVEYTNREWKPVAETIKDFRQIGGFIHRSRDAIDY